jgi:hypothetical protein
VNGLNPEILFEWAALMGLCRDRSAKQHLRYLCTAFEEGRYGKALYAYDTTMQQYHYLDGSVRPLYSKVSQYRISTFIAITKKTKKKMK